MYGLAAQAPSGWMSTALNTSMACQGYGTLWRATVAPNWPKPCANRWSDSATARATPGVPLRRRSNWARGCPRSPTRRSTDSSSPPEAGKPADEFQGGSVVLENQGLSEQDQGDLAPVGLPRRHTCGDECDRHHQLLALFEPTVPGFRRDAPRRRPPRPAQTRPTARNGSRYRHRATMLREARN